MYIPSHFSVTETQSIHDFVRAHAFATVISTVDGMPYASHVPLVLHTGADGDRLQGHVARINPHWQAWSDDAQVLVIFRGPHGYVSPTWYAAGPAVPTWNYMAVHATGTVSLLDDPASTLAALIGSYEAAPLSAELMPPAYVEKLSAHIVAFEIRVDRWEGKSKLSQNRPQVDQAKVARALAARGEAELAHAMQTADAPAAATGLNHLTLAVGDVNRAVRFYVAGLGAQLHAQWDGGAYLTVGAQWLCLSLDPARIHSASPDYTHIAFGVAAAQFAELSQRVLACGAREWKANRSEGESFYFLDPDGHQLELHVGDLASRLAACRNKPYAGMIFS